MDIEAPCASALWAEIPARGRQVRSALERLVDEPFGPEFLDSTRNPEFIEGLTAEGLKSSCCRESSKCKETVESKRSADNSPSYYCDLLANLYPALRARRTPCIFNTGVRNNG